MGGEGSMMAMITSLKNNRNLLRKKTPFERSSRYLKKFNMKSRKEKPVDPQLLEAIRNNIKADQRSDIVTMVVIFFVIILLMITFLVFMI